MSLTNNIGLPSKFILQFGMFTLHFFSRSLLISLWEQTRFCFQCSLCLKFEQTSLFTSKVVIFKQSFYSLISRKRNEKQNLFKEHVQLKFPLLALYRYYLFRLERGGLGKISFFFIPMLLQLLLLQFQFQVWLWQRVVEKLRDCLRFIADQEQKLRSGNVLKESSDVCMKIITLLCLVD